MTSKWIRLAQVLLVVLYLVAGFLNWNEAFMGSYVTTPGLVATVVALLAWLVYGFMVGRSGHPRPWLFSTVFWGVVTAAVVVGWALFTAGERIEVLGSGVFGVLSVTLFMSSASALYGVTHSIPTSMMPIALVFVPLLILVLTLSANYLGQRSVSTTK